MVHYLTPTAKFYNIHIVSLRLRGEKG